MFSKLTLNQKIGGGFGIVVFLLVVVAVVAITGLGGVVDNAGEVIGGNKLASEITQRHVDHLEWANQVNELITNDEVTTLNVQTDPHKCAFGAWYYSEARRHAEDLVPAIKGHLRDIEEHHNSLHESAVLIGNCFRQANLELSAQLEARKGDHLRWVTRVKDALLSGKASEVDVETDPRKCALGKWLASDEAEHLARMSPEIAGILRDIDHPHQRLHGSAIEIRQALERGSKTNAHAVYSSTTHAAAEQTLGFLDQIIEANDRNVKGMLDAKRVYANQTMPALHEVGELLQKIVATTRENIMTDDQMLSAASGTRMLVLICGILALVSGIVLAYIIATGISRALKPIIQGLSGGAQQVASASEQLSSASQQLSEGASEQASSLEEISSSLEEMSSMTKQNADNAKQANGMATEVSSNVKESSDAMQEMSAAIARIKTSSDETAKIIKTIDEIAMQTNLLALNAAVEAARAGEAGRGFAVVAEEVRNLAQRSAEAAKNTAELIEGAQKNAENGVSSSERVAGMLSSITEGVQKVTQLIDEVSAASSEQAEGIEQVNSAVAQMDQVTQQNASSSEESASASEELSSQAQSLSEIVDQLVRLTGGGGTSSNAAVPTPSHHRIRSSETKPLLSQKKTFPAHHSAGHKERTPSELIPFDGEDF